MVSAVFKFRRRFYDYAGKVELVITLDSLLKSSKKRSQSFYKARTVTKKTCISFIELN